MSKLIDFLAGHEGFVSKWYLDPIGIPTIGYGFTWRSRIFRSWWLKKHSRKFRRGDLISKRDALIILQKMVEEEYRPPVDRFFNAGNVSAHALDAATSMVYNCGAGALKWKWAKFLRLGKVKLSAGRWRKTATTAGGKKFAGLVRRRKEEADIAEFNRYPAWITGKIAGGSRDGIKENYENIKQTQKWLNDLGFGNLTVDGVAGKKTKQAVVEFQKAHGNLKVDGIIGVATLSALQRAIDLKNKVKITTGVGGGSAIGGGAAQETAIGFAGDLLLWGGLGLLILGFLWLAWRYRDELKFIHRGKK